MATLKSCVKCGRPFADGGLWHSGTRTMCVWCEEGRNPWKEQCDELFGEGAWEKLGKAVEDMLKNTVKKEEEK